MAFWSVAQTESQRERTAARFLQQAGVETYLPVLRARERLVPLFPRYVFVRIELGWSQIDNTVGIVQVLRSGDQPARLKDEVVAGIRRQERDGVVHLPKPRGLHVGDRVRIVRGNFADHIGLHDGMSAHQRQFVLLELLGRKVRVELQSRDVRVVSAD